MEKVQRPIGCATSVFGRTYVGMGDLPAMGLIECAGWRDPSIFTGKVSGVGKDRVHIGGSSAMQYRSSAYFETSKYGTEGYPANQAEADMKVYEEASRRCEQLGLCANCNRFVEGTPIFLEKVVEST